jgi:hypothetical protein
MTQEPSPVSTDPVRLEPCEFLGTLEAEHCSWLVAFDAQYLRNFEKLYKADYEAAMTEAAVRRFLEEQHIDVQPAEDLSGKVQRPDFLCTASNSKFYVEVTCIAIQKVIDQTALPHPSQSGTQHDAPLNDALWSACRGKAAQCGDLDYPSLVAIGTHHSSASALCIKEPKVDMLLTGTTSISWNMDVRTGSKVGDVFLSTDLRSATFLRADPINGIGFARSSVSGLLLCGFGILPHKVLGILHPNPARPFDRCLLPDVTFCEVAIDDASGTLSTHWSRIKND